MTAPESYLAEHDLPAALKALQDKIRANPADSKLRVFLFQLLSVMGQWDRALTQLNVAGDLDDATLAMVMMYRQVLTCEALREQVFAGTKDPVVLGDPQTWIALMIQALKLNAQGEAQQAGEIRQQALELAPETGGSIDGQSFDWIADGDSRLGPILEVILEGRYLWVPFYSIRSMAIEPPEDLRDSVWMPTHFTWVNGGESYGLIPTRYPGSQNQQDDLLRLAKKTQWQASAEQDYFGLGQRMFFTDQGEYAIMDARAIELSSADEEAPDGQNPS